MPAKVQPKSNIYEKAIMFLMVWLCLQDFVLPIIYKLVPSVALLKVLLHIKDLLLLLLGAISLFRRRNKGNASFYRAYIIYFLFCCIWLAMTLLFQNTTSLTNVFASFRSAILLPTLILIGMGATNGSLERFARWYLTKFMFFVCAFGLADYALDVTVGTASFWREGVGLTAYLEDIKGNTLFEGLPGNFYGQYGGSFFSRKRLVSFWASPLASGYSLLLPVLYSFVMFLEQRNGHRLKAFFLFAVYFASLLLTFTRAIIIPTILSLIILVLLLKPQGRVFASVCFVLLGLFLVVANWDALYAFLYDGSTMEHIRQTSTSFASMNWLGQGFGSIGIYSNIGTESTYITLIGSVGFLGLLLYLVLLFMPFHRVRKQQRGMAHRKVDSLVMVLLFSTIIYLLTGFISEQLTAYTAIGPFGLLLGYLARSRPSTYRIFGLNQPTPRACILQKTEMNS